MPHRRRLSTELRIVYEIARVVGSGSYEVGELMERICSEIREASGFDRALLVRMDEDTRTVHAFVQQGVEWPGDEWLPLDMFPFLGQSMDVGTAVLVADAGEEAAVPPELVERFGIRSIVAAPLMVEGRCLGFIVGDRKDGKEVFRMSEDELAFLTALGSIAAVFIDRADQYSELQQALEELRHLDRARDEFISIASHELRTPIAVVHGIASTLQQRGPELTQEQVLELRATLYGQTARLRDLAEALLDLSRLDSGAMPLKTERFRPRERIEEMLPRVIPDRVQDIEIVVEPELEISSDAHAFERVLTNLILNALSYGEPPVRVGGAPNRDAQMLSIWVDDHGHGVDPAFEPHLFDRFTRGDNSREQRQRGAGLGLAIAHAYARELGGDLRYERRELKGSRFTLELPAT